MTKQRKSRIRIPRHAKSVIEAALSNARTQGWIADYPGSHAWGIIYCPHGHSQCRMSVFSTPRVPETHAREIHRRVSKCPGPESPEE
jgi:hypothetical protein